MDFTLNETVSETVEKDDIPIYCYNFSTINSTDGSKRGEEIVFWLEGVGLTFTSIIGIIGNSITVAVLNRISLNNVFNQVRF